MRDTSGRYAQLFSAFPCTQSGFTTPPVLQSYHYSPMYSYTSPCSKTNYYSSCGSCKLSKSDAYTNQPLENFSIQGSVKGNQNVRFCGCGK